MADKKKLLEFCTGSDRVPIRGLSSLQLTISRQGPDSEQLPTSHTVSLPAARACTRAQGQARWTNWPHLTRSSVHRPAPLFSVFCSAVLQSFAAVRIRVEGQVAREAATGAAEQQGIRTHLKQPQPQLVARLRELCRRLPRHPSHSSFCNFFHALQPVSAFAFSLPCASVCN